MYNFTVKIINGSYMFRPQSSRHETGQSEVRKDII